MSKRGKPYSDPQWAWHEARADLQAQGAADPSGTAIEAFIERSQREWLDAERHAELVAATRQGAALATAPVLSVSEAAEFLRCSERTIARLIASGQLKSSKPSGGRVVIRRVDLERLLDRG